MNEITKKQLPFSVAIKTDAYKQMINGTLTDKKVAEKFVADITSVVANNYALKSCDAGSIIAGGLMANSLKLSLSSSLGYCALVPYKTKTGDKAQFQLMYKGLIQLAERTGQYKRLGVRPVHEGEYKGQDEFGDDEFKFSHEFDDKPIVGYFAYFELLNGFKKTLYWTSKQCVEHAKRYSKAFTNSTTTSLWETDFDTMAQKTVLKQLLSKYGVMSIELQTAVQADQAVIKSKDEFEYVDNETEEEVSSTVKDNLPPVDEEGELSEEEKALEIINR